MRSFTRLGATLALLALPCALPAAPPYVDIEQRMSAEQLHATGLDTLSTEQLRELNRLLREEADAAPADTSVNVPETEHRALIGLDDKPIRSRLKGDLNGWEPGTVFELENGQRWKVLKGTLRLKKSMEAPEIVVVPGIAGRWFLQLNEDLPKARVYRIN